MNPSIPSEIANPGRNARSRETAVLLCIWLVATAIAVFFSMLLKDSTYLNGSYIPRGSDSLYHARRILDAAIGERGFYQFDERLHVPDGAWIPWPWAYDYLLAKAAQIALWFNASLDPLAFLAYVPVVWIGVNAALFLAAATTLGLSLELRVGAMLAFALSPLTQLLHAIARIDHHFLEHSFVLLTIWLGLKWFKQPNDRRTAALLGLTLGVAPAFHNSLFVLQLPVLACVAILWLRSNAPPAKSLRAMAVVLLASSLVSALPSEPLRQGMFEFALLSWFHVYAAACTAMAIAFMSLERYSPSRLAALAAGSLALAAPMLAQTYRGTMFLSGQFSVLDRIVEMQSPYRMFTETMGPTGTAGYYSWLILLAPGLLVFFAYRIFKDRRPSDLYYSCSVVFGLALLMTQLRMYYFGSFALITSILFLVDRIPERKHWHPGAALAGVLAAILVLYQPGLRGRLFMVHPLASSSAYDVASPFFHELAELCAEDPGVVLASQDDGNSLLFHTECSVFANNFIMRREDENKIAEIARLLEADPQTLRRHDPEIKYLLVRAREFSEEINGQEILTDRAPIARQLLLSNTPPEGFELLRTIKLFQTGELYARLYRVLPFEN